MNDVLYDIEIKPEKHKLYSPNAQQYKTLYVLISHLILFKL